MRLAVGGAKKLLETGSHVGQPTGGDGKQVPCNEVCDPGGLVVVRAANAKQSQDASETRRYGLMYGPAAQERVVSILLQGASAW
jgi:hypothetical protein